MARTTNDISLIDVKKIDIVRSFHCISSENPMKMMQRNCLDILQGEGDLKHRYARLKLVAYSITDR